MREYPNIKACVCAHFSKHHHDDCEAIQAIIAMQERIKALEAVAEAASKMRYITRPDLTAALKAAGYNGEGE